MKRKLLYVLKKTVLTTTQIVVSSLIGAIVLYIYLMNNRPDLNLWHTVDLDEEFTVERQTDIDTFDAYLALENTLFDQLEREVYDQASTSQRSALNRFDSGSLADPTGYPKNWNRSFVLKPDQPRGGVLLVHGLSDSPYSLRTLAKALFNQGYYVLGLRMPGHGTAPSGLIHASWQDMAAAVKLAAVNVSQNTSGKIPISIVGYSMGAAQAVNYSLTALQDPSLPQVNTLVLISPAIGVSSVASLAVWQSRLSVIPGLEKLAWNSIGPEYDPYKYNSFAVNAGDQMYRLTQVINEKLLQLNNANQNKIFPRTIAFMSAIDATVSTHAVVSHLFNKIDNPENELVIYDINRNESYTPFVKKDPIEDYSHILDYGNLKFNLTLYSDQSTNTDTMMAHKWLRSNEESTLEPTDMVWPRHVYSLSHVALPFPPNDSFYGPTPESSNGLKIGQLETKGEKGLLNIAASDMLRLRYNPFYASMQKKIVEFIEKPLSSAK